MKVFKPLAIGFVGVALATLGIWKTQPKLAPPRASKMDKVTLIDVHGKPLTSIFWGAQRDSRYSAFKRLIASKVRDCEVSRQPSHVAVLWKRFGDFGRLLGISTDFVVHAQDVCPQACGYRLVQYTQSCPGCGDDYYDGPITGDPSSGIGTGGTVCTSGPSCPGTGQTVGCPCDSDDDDSIFDDE